MHMETHNHADVESIKWAFLVGMLSRVRFILRSIRVYVYLLGSINVLSKWQSAH